MIRSEFGTTERISLTGKLSTIMFIHFSYGLIPETIVTNCEEYSNVDSSTKILHIDSKACNDEDLTTFTINKLPDLIYLQIDSWNFKDVVTFDIHNHHNIENINIESNSFVERNQQYYYDPEEIDNEVNKSFHIQNCSRLLSITIGDFCFATYGGAFELKNLPSLLSINIGKDTYGSYNFYWSSFEVRGNK